MFKFFKKRELPRELTSDQIADRVNFLMHSKLLNDQRSVSTKTIKLSLRSLLRDPNLTIN